MTTCTIAGIVTALLSILGAFISWFFAYKSRRTAVLPYQIRAIQDRLRSRRPYDPRDQSTIGWTDSYEFLKANLNNIQTVNAWRARMQSMLEEKAFTGRFHQQKVVDTLHDLDLLLQLLDEQTARITKNDEP